MFIAALSISPVTSAYAECDCTPLSPPTGTTATVSTVDELFAAVAEANARTEQQQQENFTILVEDGIYNIGKKTLRFSSENVTIRSLSGNRDAVSIYGAGMSYSGNQHVFEVYDDNFTAADMTIGRVSKHAIQIHGEDDADNPLIHNLRILDAGEQMIKVSHDGSSNSSDDGIVEWCHFEYTAGIGPQWYIGGVDAHYAHDWIIRNNVFKHIRSPEDRLPEHAIHFWAESSNTLVEKNTIIDCDRGIGFGLDVSGHIGGIIKNNMIHTTRDTGISLWKSENTLVYNNTVYTENYKDSIDYRYSRSHNIRFINNLTNKNIKKRDGASATLANNVTNASASWFVDATSGDLHLVTSPSTVVDQGQTLSEVTVDFDCESRPKGAAYEIGADEIGADPETYEISGWVTTDNDDGIAGVVLSGLPGNPTTDADGQYSAIVEEGWSGTVTPQKTDYTFTPEIRTYSDVSAEQTDQNYTGNPVSKTFTISGTVSDTTGTGIAGVVLSGLPGNPTTDADGQYSATVSEGWSGTVTPQKADYTFTPEIRTYSDVSAEQTDQNYTGNPVSKTFTISGTVSDTTGTGIAGVVLSGLPGNPTTDADGQYSATVADGWSGTVTPQKDDYTFSPASLLYSHVKADQVHQDYIGASTPKTFTISGRVSGTVGTGIAGVVLSGLPGNPTTDTDGQYSVTVVKGWSGLVTPQKAGYTFTPETRVYADVASDQLNQDYTGTSHSSYFGYEEFGGTWHDAAQAVAEEMAWAAAAANILEWSGWDTPSYETAQEIFENFEDHWTDDEGLMEYGWYWWFNGYEPTSAESSSQVDVSGEGDYWSDYDFFNYFHEDWAEFSDGQWSNGEHLMQSVDTYLHSGFGVTVAVYEDDDVHDLSVWGYEYDDTGAYTGIWVTDSTDSINDIILLSVELIDGLWYLDLENLYGYKNWFIGGVQALEQQQKPIPEPGTCILLSLGLIGCFTLRRKMHKRS